MIFKHFREGKFVVEHGSVVEGVLLSEYGIQKDVNLKLYDNQIGVKNPSHWKFSQKWHKVRNACNQM